MRSSVKWAVALIVLALMAPYRAGALGLGDIKLRSYLNQPLKAEIGVSPGTADDLADARVTLASSDAFQKAGIDRPAVLSDLKFTLEKGADGKPYIRVSSPDAIREPFLDFIVQVSWSKGQLLREYTVLLDPPVTTDEAAPPVQPAVAGTDQPAQTPATVQGDSAAAFTPTAPAAQAAGAGAPATAVPTRSIQPHLTKDSYGPTHRSDTLWSIAGAIRPNDGVSVQQVMLALVKTNPDAFYGGNVNTLKAGYILRLPDMKAMTAVAQADAVHQVQQQYRQWLDMKQAGKAPGDGGHPGGRIARGGATATAGQTAGRLKLLPADADQPAAGTAGAGGGAQGGAANQQLASALENSEAQKQENEQLQTRLSELNDQVQSLQRLLSLKDDTLAALQHKLAQLQGQPTNAAVTAPPAPQGQGATAAPAPSVATPPAAVTAAKQPAAAHPARPKRAVAMPPVHATGPLWQDPKVLGIGGAVILLLGALGWVIVRRRQMDSDGFMPAAAAAGAPASPSGGEPAAAVAKEPHYVPTGGDLLETEVDEIDPLAEADVYMAYRRYQQAEELLKSAIDHEPQRQELRMKLLEVYASAENADAFVAAAENFYNEFGGGDNPLWDKVSIMGRDVQPDHPLFNGQGSTAAAGDDGDADLDLDDLLRDAPGVTAGAGQAAMSADTAGDATNMMDERPAAAADTGAEDDAGADDGVIEYEAGLAVKAEAAPAADAASDAEAEIDNAIEFSMTGDDTVAGDKTDTAADVVAAPPAPAGDMNPGDDDLDFTLDFDAIDSGDKDLDNFFEGLETVDAAGEDDHESHDDGASAQEDVGTRLDLAKAFMEMGDQDGARDILKEVADMGDDDQQREARELLQQLEADA